MKNYTLLLLLFALGCHSSVPNGATAGTAGVQNINPALVKSDTTLGCQNLVPTESAQPAKYSDMIDGNAGLYTLQSATMYSESQPNTNKNASFVFQNDKLDSKAEPLTAKQAIPCFDFSRLTSGANLSPWTHVPLEINRVDGKIASDALFNATITYDGSAAVSVPTVAKAPAAFTDLQSFIATVKTHHSRTVQIFKIDANTVHILITDKFVTAKKNKGIKVTLAVYKLS